MRKLLILFFILSSLPAFSKKNAQGVTITYQSSFNGVVDTTGFVILQISDDFAKIHSTRPADSYSPKIITYINFADSTIVQSAELRDNKLASSFSNFKYENGWKFLDGTETVAGIECKKAKVIINSNTIEIFYNDEMNFYGTPSPNYGVCKGVVLKTVMNGNRVQEAVNVSYSKKSLNLKPDDYGTVVESNVLRKMINENSTIVVDVFENQRICFDTSIKSPTDYSEISEDEVYRFANGTIVLKKVTLPDSAWNYDIFAELSQYSDGDAYDRTGSVFVIPTYSEISFLDGLLKGVECLPSFQTKNGDTQYGKVSTDDYVVPVELIRFFTGFGTRKYNHIKYGDFQWNDSVIYKQDVSQYASLLSNEAWIGVFIGNYDKGGHIIDLKLKFHPSGEGKRKNVVPLFCTLNIMEMAGQCYSDFFDADSLFVDFNLDVDAENVYLSYISTGHGGWGGGDEFNRKPNTILLDDTKVVYTPWRCDCASNREKNPCSGNSINGLTSSDYSRSGWCPGTITNPVEFFYEKLSKGKHNITIAIPQGPREGSSFSAWNVSGCLIY